MPSLTLPPRSLPWLHFILQAGPRVSPVLSCASVSQHWKLFIAIRKLCDCPPIRWWQAGATPILLFCSPACQEHGSYQYIGATEIVWGSALSTITVIRTQLPALEELTCEYRRQKINEICNQTYSVVKGDKAMEKWATLSRGGSHSGGGIWAETWRK